MPATATLRTVQYLTDTEGRRTGVLLDIQAWESLVEWIENATDARAAVKALTELTAAGGGREAGWVAWEDVREEWAGEPPEGGRFPVQGLGETLRLLGRAIASPTCPPLSSEFLEPLRDFCLGLENPTVT